MSKVNRNFKAGVFTHLFGVPQNELELYNAFSPVYYPPETSVTDLTLTDALYMDRINDLASEVINMLLQEWKIEDARLVWREEGKVEGIEEGIVKGIEKEKRKTIFTMKRKNFTDDVISEITELTLEQVREILAGGNDD